MPAALFPPVTARERGGGKTHRERETYTGAGTHTHTETYKHPRTGAVRCFAQTFEEQAMQDVALVIAATAPPPAKVRGEDGPADVEREEEEEKK